MENEVHAHRDGFVRRLSVAAGAVRLERPGDMSGGARVTVAELVHDLVPRDALTGATLSKPRRRDTPGYAKATIRAVETERGRRYAWTAHFPTRTTTETLAPDEAERRLAEALTRRIPAGAPARHRGGLPGARRREGAAAPGDEGSGRRVARRREAAGAARGRPGAVPRRARRHDARGGGARCALGQVPPGRPLPRGGGGRTARPAAGGGAAGRRLRLGQVVPDLRAAPPAHEPCTTARWTIVGLDLKADVVRDCGALADRLGSEGLRFAVGDIGAYEAAGVAAPRRQPARLRHGDGRGARAGRALGRDRDPGRAVLPARAGAARSRAGRCAPLLAPRPSAGALRGRRDRRRARALAAAGGLRGRAPGAGREPSTRRRTCSSAPCGARARAATRDRLAERVRRVQALARHRPRARARCWPTGSAARRAGSQRHAAALRRAVARARRGHRRHGQPGGALGAGRVRRLSGRHDPLDAAPFAGRLRERLAAQLRAIPRSRLLLVKRPAAAARTPDPRRRRATPERGARCGELELERYSDLLELDLAALCSRRAATARRCASAAARLHPRQARPLLRPLRAAAVRGAAPQAPRVLAVAGEPRRRRPLRRQRRGAAGGHLLRPRDARRRARAARRVPRGARSHSTSTAAARATRSRSRPRRSRVRRATAASTASGISSFAARSGSARTAWRIGFRAEVAGEVHEVEVARELGEPSLHVHARASEAPRGGSSRARAALVGRRLAREAQEALAHEAAQQHEPAGLVEPAREVGAPRTAPSRTRCSTSGSACGGKRRSRPSNASASARPRPPTSSATTVGRRSSRVSAPSVSSARSSESWPSSTGRRRRRAGARGGRARPRRGRGGPRAGRARSSAPAPSAGSERRNSTSSSQPLERRTERVEPGDDVHADGQVERVLVRGERLVQPAARQVERVAGSSTTSSTVSPGAPISAP